MAKRDTYKADPAFSYPDHFDLLMQNHFGEEFKTEWNLFQGSFGGYQTRRVNGKRMTKTMARVGKSISDAMAAGRSEYVPA